MKNIELKIKLNDFKRVVSQLKKIGAKYINQLHQIDTYFNIKSGRLKIRNINNKIFELIYYQRPNKKSSKISNYQILNIKKNQIQKIKSILKKSLEVKIIIEKDRGLWQFNNTRIHLDRVKKLGNFLELETVVKKNLEEARIEHSKIINLLNLKNYKKCSNSYSDLALKTKK